MIRIECNIYVYINKKYSYFLFLFVGYTTLYIVVLNLYFIKQGLKVQNNYILLINN